MIKRNAHFKKLSDVTPSNDGVLSAKSCKRIAPRDKRGVTMHSKRAGFSLLELSVVMGVIALVVGMSLSVGDKQVDREEVRSSFNELRVIKEALRMYGERYNRLPCPTPITLARNDANFGLPAADCDATPTAGVTHIASPAAKSGGVPYKVLGLTDAFAADDWGNRYVYVVDDAFIAGFDSDDEGQIIINDRGSNVITNEAAFTVFSHGKTGLGAIDHLNLSTDACSATQLDRENCGGTAGTYMDSSIRETQADATYYDDMLVWAKRANILNEVATVTPDDPPVTGCVAGAGMVISGIDSSDLSGNSVSSAGDVNGDGYDDIIIGSNWADPGGNSAAGESYLVFGKASGWPTSLDLSSLGSDGVVINGIDAGDQSGQHVSSAGDVNGDGYDDILIGAPLSDPGGNSIAGESYLVFGKASWATSLNLSALGTGGVVINGIDADDRSGILVSSAGDVNGDGYDDVLIGAYQADPGGNNQAGESYLVFGKASGWPTSLDLSSLGSDGVVINGIDAGDRLGWGAAGAGDVNGDGYDDILIGAYGADPGGNSQAGESYLVFGKASGWPTSLDLSSLGSDGVVINGIDAGDFSGFSVSSAGDVNGDGYDDLLIGAYGAAPGGNSGAGESYLIFGKASWATSLNLSALGTGGVVINGIDAGDLSGKEASYAGDVNGDGYDDFIVGAEGADSSGESYLIFGKASGWPTSLDLSALDGSNGVLLDGVYLAGLNANSLSSAGDVNNDGFDDILIGDYRADANGTDSGESYLILGNSDWSTTSGVVELGALEDPAECTSNACTLTVEMDLDADADETSWNIVNGDGKKILVGSYTAADDNTVDSRTYALPRGSYSYDITLKDSTGSGLATVNDHLNVNIGAAVSSHTGTDGFVTCEKTFSTNTSCGFNNGGDTDMTCGSCTPVSGATINGVAAGDGSGAIAVNATAGDVNGDGYDDLIIGMQEAGTNGVAYVVFGKQNGWTTPIELSSLNGSNGFALIGEVAGDKAGASVDFVGDVNGDGYDDIVVGSPGKDTGRGSAHVVFGKAAGWTSTVNLSTVTPLRGVEFYGDTAGGRNGFSVSGAGDVNGDGLNDILVGAPEASGEGIATIIYGKAGGWAATFGIADIDGSNGVILKSGVAGDELGYSVASVGDFNRDGYDDVIIGSLGDDTNGSQSGAAYVLFGSDSLANMIATALSGSGGFKVTCSNANDRCGDAVGGAGDINGDGFDDVLVGSIVAGEVYVIFGDTGWSLAAADASDIKTAAIAGFALAGGASDAVGFSVAGGSDINNDGYDDMVIGAPKWTSETGQTYVVFGKAAGWPDTTLALSSLNGTTGFAAQGIDVGDAMGTSVGTAGDVDGDGYGEIIVSASGGDPNGADSGEVYLLFGSPEAYSATHALSSLGDPASCSGCSPACNSGCNGTTLELKACQSGTCNTLSSTADAPQCAADITGPQCELTCGGTQYPTPGDVCTDGSVYAGVSLDKNKCMYTTPADAADATWADASTVTGVTDDTTGELNTNILAGLADTFTAADYCAALSVYSKDDWYLPAPVEAKTLYDERVAIGGFNATGRYWTSTEIDASDAIIFNHSTGSDDVETKTVASRMRCVRKDGDETTVACDVSCGGVTNPDIGDSCADGSIFAGISADGDVCMYTTPADAGTTTWSDVTVVTGVTDVTTGEANTASLAALADNYPAADNCDALNVHSNTDWYLPSRLEATELYNNLTDIGGFNSSDTYWMSLESDASTALMIDFSSGAGATNGKTNTGLYRCVRKDGAPPVVTCDVSCGGSFTPTPGAVCTDGSIYAGVTPDGDFCMYTTPADQSQQVWNNASGTTGMTSDVTGQSNTATLVGLGVSYRAANTCGLLTDHSKTDWYLPATKELGVLSTSYADIGGFSNANYWTSTEITAANTSVLNPVTSASSDVAKTNTQEIRCVRKDSTPVTCDVSCGGSFTPTPGAVCTDGSVYAGVTPDGDVCMYTTPASEAAQRWSNVTIVTGVTSDIEGEANTKTLDGLSSTDYSAANTCAALTSHSNTDWYLPAGKEMDVMYTSKADIGGFVDAEHWISAESDANNAQAFNMTGATLGTAPKGGPAVFRCVRKDGTTPAVTCDVSCGGSFTPTPGAVCTDGSIYVGISPDGNVCMYSIDAVAPLQRWLNSGIVTESLAGLVTGADNTAEFLADGHDHPAASYCAGRTDHGKGDWYLPARAEAELWAAGWGLWPAAYAEGTDIIWTSSNSGASSIGQAWAIEQDTGIISEPTTNNSLLARCMRKDSGGGGGGGGGSVICSQSCGGSVLPSPGDVCADGSIYAGVSADGNVCMYLPAVGSAGNLQWAVATPHVTSATDDNSGASNTGMIMGSGGPGHPAASTCDGVTAHGQSDWYLPAVSELQEIYDNRVSYSFVAASASHWSSTEVSGSNAKYIDFSTGTTSNDVKTTGMTTYCVRRDTDATTVMCSLSCGATFTPSVGDICTDGSMYVGISPDGNRCMYLQQASFPGSQQWATVAGTVSGATSDISGSTNTTTIIGTPGTHPSATACDSLSVHGATDWYLPANDELNVIAANTGTIGFPVGTFWSSTEIDANNAKYSDFETTLTTAANKTSIHTTICVRKDPAPACALSCGGSIYPTPGALCTDGSIYAGVSPDGGKCMYTTAADYAANIMWANSTGAFLSTTSSSTGAANTNTQASYAPITHPAAQACTALVSSGKSDWYVPAYDELSTLRINSGAIGGFVAAGYWSSTEGAADNAVGIAFGSPLDFIGPKTDNNRMRCVRKDP